MSEWKVVFTKEAYKAYSKLENAYKKALKRQITKLIERRKSDIKPVKGYENLYRI